MDVSGRLSTVDLAALCLQLEGCVCAACGHGHHDLCDGTYTLFSGDLTSCECVCQQSRPQASGCDVCGVGADDECSPDCEAEPLEPDSTSLESPLLVDVLAGLAEYLFNQPESLFAKPNQIQ